MVQYAISEYETVSSSNCRPIIVRVNCNMNVYLLKSLTPFVVIPCATTNVYDNINTLDYATKEQCTRT